MRAAIAAVYERMQLRLGMLTAYAWAGAGSLIGFEAFGGILGWAALSPQIVVVVVATLAIVYFVRRRRGLTGPAHDEDHP